MNRDSRWLLAKDGRWYCLQAIKWCPELGDNDECELNDGPNHYCEETLWARERHSSMKVEIAADIYRLPAVEDEEPAWQPRGKGGAASSDTSGANNNYDLNVSRSHTFSPGNA